MYLSIAGALLVAGPLLTFTRFHQYSLTAPEFLLTLTGVAACGAGVGILATISGRVLGATLVGGLWMLYLDLQVDWFVGSPGWLVGATAATILCAWALWPGLSELLVTVLVPMTVVGFLASGSMPPSTRESAAPTRGPAARDESLPPILHIILDAHSGIEGLPNSIDPTGRARQRIVQSYTERGFRVFGRAYSQYVSTKYALPQLVNFGSTSPGGESLQWVEADIYRLAQNKYFDTMAERGYSIGVLQADYIDFCAHSAVSFCETIPASDPLFIREVPVSTWQKARLLASQFLGLSYGFSVLRYRWAWLASRGWPLPEFPLPEAQLWPIGGMRALDRLRSLAAELEPGTLVFAHVMLPHSPAIYRANCEIDPDRLSFATPNVRGGDGINLGERSAPRRQAAYENYLMQLQCVTEQMAEVVDAVATGDGLHGGWTIVHGDHGGRFTTHAPRAENLEKFTNQDYVDAFSTLFAIRPPEGDAAYDRRMVPLPALLEAFVENGAIPDGVGWVHSAPVFWQGMVGAKGVAMPDFSSTYWIEDEVQR